jgi:predicted DNA-binding transcriptional regulator AlpA
MNEHQLLTPKEVSDILGISEQTLAIWRCNKRYDLKYVKVGRYVRYRYGDVLEFIQSRTIENPEVA